MCGVSFVPAVVGLGGVVNWWFRVTVGGVGCGCFVDLVEGVC